MLTRPSYFDGTVSGTVIALRINTVTFAIALQADKVVCACYAVSSRCRVFHANDGHIIASAAIHCQFDITQQ